MPDNTRTTDDGMQVTLIDHMGSDISVVNAARVSFAKTSHAMQDGTITEADAKLIRYLARHNHWTPFAHTAVSFRVKAPIFVARQLAKHQIGMVWNEVSRRYVDDAPECWIPSLWRSRAENVKQGSGEAIPEDAVQARYIAAYSRAVGQCIGVYEGLLREGVCPEQARAVLPQAMFTEWVWTGTLAAWARVCKLRLDSHTQAETRNVAELFAVDCARLFPVSWAALMN